MMLRGVLFAPLVLTLGATAGADSRYEADIRWTSYGIPHVKAADWGSLGYGFAYATATDGICVFAREVATANGTLSVDFGESRENVASDAFHRAIVTAERVQQNDAAMSDEMRAYNVGFVAGYNRYIEDNRENLPAACAGQPWVRPIVGVELGRMFISFGVRYSSGYFKEGMVAAAPPGKHVASLEIDFDLSPQPGSNAIALGGGLTRSGRGILFGNPHYPWHGPARFHMIHTTIPGVVNTMGASLLAGNFIAIGFNENVAWTHTVSTAARFTLFALELHPDDPMRYRHGSEFRDIESIEVAVPVLQSSGDVVDREKTIYLTHYGPIVVSKDLPWTAKRAYAIRDAIIDNDAAIPTYEALQTAASVADVETAISKQGIFFVNTIAADKDGKAFYADISSTPNLDAKTIADCRKPAKGLPAFVIVLDGADPDCDWRVDSRSTVPGNMPATEMPRAMSTGYFTNSNDSYWLSNPDEPLEGYSPVIGPERTARSLRTRAGLVFLRERLDLDDKLRPDTLQDILFSHRHFGAELLLDDVLRVCGEGRRQTSAACDVLRKWDRTANVDSLGMQVWTEFWENARHTRNLFEVPFDVQDPVNTPRGIATDNRSVRKAVRDALASAQKRLMDAGIKLDAPWGDVQFAERNGNRVPVPGGPGRHGMFSFINAGLAKGKGYTPIQHGNSYIQVVTWNDDGSPDARAILTYSQSPEPDSLHYSDQTELYALGEWIDLPFTEEEILADPNLKTLTLRE